MQDMQVEHDTLTAENQNEDGEGNDNEPAERPRVHVALAALLFGRGVELDFAVPAPGAIFKLAPQDVVDGDIGIFMRLDLGRAAANDEWVPWQSDIGCISAIAEHE